MIRPLGLGEIAAAVGTTIPGRDAEVRVDGVSTDSRSVRPGDLFVALRGERFDAHDFLADVQDSGAAALVCSRAVSARIPVLQVPDTLLALGAVAALHRSLFDGRVVALTGSAGKTTTKEMLAAVLAPLGPVLATAGNLNNEIGVPLTLFRLEGGHRHAVVEMGAGKPGDIAYLANIARPDVALLTNALPAHLERLGTLEEVARTKGAIYESLGPGGVAVLNGDDAFASYWAGRIGDRRCIRVSARGEPGAEIRALDVAMHEGCASFVLHMPGSSAPVRLAIPGVQQVANAVMAAGVAHARGLDALAVAAALAELRPVAGRMRALGGRGGSRLIDDTYNANPGSMRAAIDTLAGFGGLRVLALGEMAELGPAAAALHREIGAHAALRGIDRLLATGRHAAALAEGFGAGAEVFANRDALVEACRGMDRAGVVLLVKGSRSAGMEAVIAALAEDDTPGLARTGTH